jgi:carbamoyl-phosphate synthase large subunit
VDPATILAAEFKLKTKTNCFIPVSTPDLCKIFFDKQLTYDWSISNKVQVPTSKLQFPMIAKPIHGSASAGIYVLQNQEEYKNFFSRKNISEYNVQKFIDGIEYSVDVYVSLNNQKVISVVPRIRLEVLGGESIKSQTIKDLELIYLSETVALKSGLVGPLVIQFIKDKITGVIYLMEINPRFGGAVLCSIGAGVDFPGYVIDDMLGIELKENQNKWTENMLMVRRFSEYFIKK